MKTFFRFVMALLFKTYLRPSHKGLDTVVSQHRVGLRDLDLNWHLNNARYLTYMDAARVEHGIHTGLLAVFPRKMNFIVANVEISYIRSLLPRQKFTVASRIVCWDERYYYMEYRFEVGEQVYAIAHARLVFMKGPKRLDANVVLADILGLEQSPEVPAVIKHWQDTLAAKRAPATKAA